MKLSADSTCTPNSDWSCSNWVSYCSSMNFGRAWEHLMNFKLLWLGTCWLWATCSLWWQSCCVCLGSSPEKTSFVLFWDGCEKGSNKCRMNSLLMIVLISFLSKIDWWHLRVTVGRTCRTWRRAEYPVDKRQGKTKFVVDVVIIT